MQADFKKDSQKVGKQDPYCVLKLGTQSTKTGVHIDAGKNARWSDICKLPRETEETLEILIMNKNDLSKDTKLGYGCLGLRSIIWSRIATNKVLDIIKGEEIVGMLSFQIEFA